MKFCALIGLALCLISIVKPQTTNEIEESTAAPGRDLTTHTSDVDANGVGEVDPAEFQKQMDESMSIDDLIKEFRGNQEEQDFSKIRNPTVMRYTYGESDPLGPFKWESLPNAKDTTNSCGSNAYSPAKINSSTARLGMVPREEENAQNALPRLVFRIHPDAVRSDWYFGHPLDTYNGLQIKAGSLGLFQVYDNYNSHETNGRDESRMYDFTYAHLTYCDYSKASANRSTHQIDGKKFPIELNMLFFWAPVEIGIDLTINGLNEGKYVMISLLGKVEGEDNPRWKPLIEAIQEFQGGSFDLFFNSVKLKSKFSITWLIPRETNYYYYNSGNFPVPPCFPVPRVYVISKPFTISKRQFNVLTSISSSREPTGKLPCTVGFLQTKVGDSDLMQNPYPIEFSGRDYRPKFLKSGDDADEGGADQSLLSKTCLWLCFCTIYLLKRGD